MPDTDLIFDDLLMRQEDGETPASTRITIVKLPSDEIAQARFMTKIRAQLQGKFSETALSPIPGVDGHALGCASERFIREQLGLSTANHDDEWCQKLVTWGANGAQILHMDAFKAILDRRNITSKSTLPPKVFLADAQASPQPTPIPKDAAGMPTISSLAATAEHLDWHLDHRGANIVAAWKKFNAERPDIQGLPWKDIKIGHLDTGYIPHEALAWNPSKTSSATILASQGYDYFALPNDPDPMDPWLPGFPGHGTRIDGAIAGYEPTDQAHPFYGAAPGVQVIPYRVTDSVMVDHVPGNIADAIEKAVSVGCHIITICLGALRGSQRVARAVDLAYEKGVIVVCAAGQVWPWVIYPGRFNRVMTVSGIGPGRVPWGSAACGRYVDWCGPADQIRRLNIKPKGVGYQTGINPRSDGDGTSYATALSSGIAAMWLSWHGIAKLRATYGGQEWMIPAAFKRTVKATCEKWVKGSDYASNYGTGIIDAERLLTVSLPAAGSLTSEALAAHDFDASH